MNNQYVDRDVKRALRERFSHGLWIGYIIGFLCGMAPLLLRGCEQWAYD